MTVRSSSIIAYLWLRIRRRLPADRYCDRTPSMPQRCRGESPSQQRPSKSCCSRVMHGASIQRQIVIARASHPFTCCVGVMARVAVAHRDSHMRATFLSRSQDRRSTTRYVLPPSTKGSKLEQVCAFIEVVVLEPGVVPVQEWREDGILFARSLL